MQEWTIDLTGEMSPIKRVSFWEAKRVFFVTPQVLEKDIESGESLEMIYFIILILMGWILSFIGYASQKLHVKFILRLII